MVIRPIRDIRQISNLPEETRDFIIVSSEKVSPGGWAFLTKKELNPSPRPKQKVYKIKAEVNNSRKHIHIRGVDQ